MTILYRLDLSARVKHIITVSSRLTGKISFVGEIISYERRLNTSVSTKAYLAQLASFIALDRYC